MPNKQNLSFCNEFIQTMVQLLTARNDFRNGSTCIQWNDPLRPKVLVERKYIF